MHNSPQSQPQTTEIDSIAIQMFNDDDDHHHPATSSYLWDWTDFLDFDQFTSPPFPPPPPELPPPPPELPPTLPELPPPPPEQSPEPTNSDKIRKRDPRLVCSNFLAGRVPCACPELDAKLAEMEEEEEIGPGKKKARTVRVGPSGFRCQVPNCGVDISELKGYHKRHKVCLGCANAISVFIDEENKRYCQQCGKFHILSDFDEGKRSCRRKLERHNNRRRRKSTDPKGLPEGDAQPLLSAEDAGCDDVTVGVSLNNQEVEKEALLDVERPASLLCSAPSSQNIQSDSGISLAGSGETLCDEEKEKCNQSPSYNDNKNVFSSVCPTGRISFKLYDWNPAEFPRRLRHQIFQWLASMPVELEGYVRPGCTILTVFIAMPDSMWVKLCGDPVASIQSLVAPASMLFGKGSFYVYLNNVIFRVLKDSTSVVKVQVKTEAPKLHYVHPTCFEAGKPMEFLVCGSNLLQPKFRLLVSFSGDYLSYDDISYSSLKNIEDDDTCRALDHQLLKICVPRTESNLFGPAFIEVENESGVSNFIPILIGDQLICSEMNILQRKLDTSLRLRGFQFAAAISSSSCDISILRQKYFSDFILDVAWLLKGSPLENKQKILTTSHIQRFNGLLKFLIENQSFVILERVAYHVKIRVYDSLISGVSDADMKLCKKNINDANARLSQKFQRKDVIMEENKFNSLTASTSLDKTESLLSSDSDDNGEDFLILANTKKRQKTEDDHSDVSENLENAVESRQKIEGTVDGKTGLEGSRKKQTPGRDNSTSGRKRGSRANDRTKQKISPPTVLQSNGQLENSCQKDHLPKDQHRLGDNIPVEEVASLRLKVVGLEEGMRKLEEDMRKLRLEASEDKHARNQLDKELKEFKELEQQMKPKRLKVLSDLLISVSKAERQDARMKVRQDSLRLGNVGVIRAGTVISETWEDGQAIKDLNVHLRQLLEMKEAVERQRKLLKKRQSDKGAAIDSEAGTQEEDFLIQDEIYKSRLASIKREEETLIRERDRYEIEKGRLIREMKRIRDEDGSRFNNFQILNHRYALLNLLGKGGFSEVYKAFDLVEQRYVACKLHGLNAQWSEEKKQSYIRHAIREYNIHKTLVHHHIVRLWDTFEIDQNTFCTVLEYCSGKDLDAVLKATPILPEKEARIIIVQIFQGLVYLNKRTQKIIHYDLKPGNVLFDELGVAKVTDFGLSKIVEDDVGSQGMELTSQGAGTYWYLPPECFELNKTPFISSKVDVWSAGILMYQMLFGRRPFGHDQTQERILREDTIIKAHRVEFPSRPAVSSEVKEFIRRCLTYNQAERPDVLTMALDPYLTYTKK